MVGIAVNLLGLAYYKYGTFVWTLSSEAVDLLGFHPLPSAPLIPLPVGISFFGRAWSEPALLKIAYGFEQTFKARKPPQFLPSIPL